MRFERDSSLSVPPERGAEQEAQSVTRQLGEELIAQVVGHEPVVAGEPGQRTLAIGLILERECREIEAGGPALRALDEHGHVAGAESESGQQDCRLAARHDEVAGPELDEAAVGAQASDRQRRLGTRGERQLRSVRQVIDDRLEELE